jgi:hypothetical protein
MDPDRTQPPALGFVMKHLLMTDDEIDDATERLASFAQQEGFNHRRPNPDRHETSKGP